MHEIECEGKDGKTRKFVFNDPTPRKTLSGYYEYSFWIGTRIDDVVFFELRLIEKPDGELRIDAISGNDTKYSAKGIPEALLPFVSRLLGKRICSSRSKGDDNIIRTYGSGTTEFRTEDATKMWNRLVSKGLAEYYPDEDIYRLNPMV